MLLISSTSAKDLNWYIQGNSQLLTALVVVNTVSAAFTSSSNPAFLSDSFQRLQLTEELLDVQRKMAQDLIYRNVIKQFN